MCRLLLTAIYSLFDREVFGNKLSFPLCSTYISLISNKYNKFRISCECKNMSTKFEELISNKNNKFRISCECKNMSTKFEEWAKT